MIHLLAFVIGFAADLAFGDPLGAFHIVVWIGKLISRLEKMMRKLFPGTPRGELAGGAVTVTLVCILSLGLSWALLYACGRVHFVLRLIVESFLCWQCLAATSLRRESMLVYTPAVAGNLSAARKAVGRIVGRDTENLTMEAAVRACVETIAENTSDGEIAPLLYLAIGTPFGVLYKAINTMDSMLGYKNDRYLYFGRVAARLDDVANYIPARLTALVMTLGAFVTGLDGKNAWRIFRRDRYNHTSPNSAQSESVCAGALHVQMGGPSVYFGKLKVKPTIGDADRPIEPEDIRRANRLMLAASCLFFAVCLIAVGAVVLFGRGMML
ncbi:MAG: cobalamin biosynthesis protein CobD [Oscillospiraceae bacterium]|nr:cobalamin biosynthesis protein CobD [Oscillospiraceae bacterium]